MSQDPPAARDLPEKGNAATTEAGAGQDPVRRATRIVLTVCAVIGDAGEVIPQGSA